MHCNKRITDDLVWVGANDRRLFMFEGVYSVPHGVSYNAYLLSDEKTVLFNTTDKAVRQQYLENVAEALGGRPLDYLVVQHMEPDHSAALEDLAIQYPNMTVICNAKTKTFIEQFFDREIKTQVVQEGEKLTTGKHTIEFLMAPMVHWPEVMVAYDETDKILFSADAFGSFGALNGAIFADEVNFERDYMEEARRYYTNIVGKYGNQVQALLKKAAAREIRMICSLHGFVWRKRLSTILSTYEDWSTYRPEETGVMIAYASIYGHTENTAEILSSYLRDRGIQTVMYDVSVIPPSEIISAAFRWSHFVFASTTYNAGIFISMESVISDLVAHNIQNRKVAIIENGSWAPTSGKLMREWMEKCKDITFLGDTFHIKSSLKADQMPALEALAQAIAADIRGPEKAAPAELSAVDPNTMFKLSYGLFVLSARDGDKDNGCIINTVTQVTSTPMRISIAVNKTGFTHDMIVKAGEFAISVLDESVEFSTFERFGFHSGKDTDKFAGCAYDDRTAGGIRYVPESANAMIEAKVVATHDYGTHTIFVADVTEAKVLSGERSVTYQYYFDHIKPKRKPSAEKKKGYVCKICGYVYEGDTLPDDYICPLCKHGAADFEPL